MHPKDEIDDLVRAGNIPKAISLATGAGMSNIGQIITDGVMNWDPVPDFPNVQVERRATS
ncbi:MAG: hypothetical protein WC468_02245 [Candidatus Paceibacterota bacterium]